MNEYHNHRCVFIRLLKEQRTKSGRTRRVKRNKTTEIHFYFSCGQTIIGISITIANDNCTHNDPYAHIKMNL